MYSMNVERIDANSVRVVNETAVFGDINNIDITFSRIQQCKDSAIRSLKKWIRKMIHSHHSDVVMSTKASQVTSLTIVYSTVYSGTDERKHQSSASLSIVRGIPRWPVNSPCKESLTRKMPPFDDVTMVHCHAQLTHQPYSTSGIL